MSDLVITMEDSTPTPPSGTVSIYPKTDGIFYTKNAAGVERSLKGDQGIQGETGPGVASGGTAGQVLKKQSGTDYATEWAGLTATEIANSASGNLAAVNVQAALNELQSDIDTLATGAALTAHINDTTDAHAASAITNTPAGNVAATTVQAAIDELQTDIDTRALDADLDAHTGDTANPHGVTKTQVGLGNVQDLDQTDPANITEDATHRFATDAEKTLWNAQDALKIKGVIVNDAAKADKKVLQYDQATDRVIYADAAGGGGGGSIQWVEGTNSPLPAFVNDMLVHLFSKGLVQTLSTVIRVPTSYVAGKQIKLTMPWFSPDNSGTVAIATNTRLLRTGITDVASGAGTHLFMPSVDMTGKANILQAQVLELTNASGQVNGVAVAPGDVLRVYLFRTTDTATSDVSVISNAAEVSFQ